MPANRAERFMKFLGVVKSVLRSASRKCLWAYARWAPYHWKKEGLVMKLSHYLGLDGEELLPGVLRFGGSILCRLSEELQQRIYYFGTYEPRTEELVHRLVNRGAVVLDVGANIGIYSLLAAKKAGAQGKVIALEPVPAIFRQLCEGLRRNGCSTVTPLNCAAWRVNGEVQMGCPDVKGNSGSYGIERQGTVESIVRVKAMRLDDLLNPMNLPRVDLIKMDIEGPELPAL